MRILASNPDTIGDLVLRQPLYSSAFAKGYGTLYTAVYRPEQLEVEYRWPTQTWRFGFDAFEEGSRTVAFEAEALP